MEPAFTGIWIPREVLEHEGLSMTDKFVYAIVDGLNNEDGCWASNGYIAKIASVSDRQVKNIIKTLVECGLVVRQTAPDGSRVLRTVAKVALLKARGEADFLGGVKPISPRGVKQTSPNSIGNKIIDRKVDLPFGETFRKAWEDWVGYRLELRKPIKHSTMKAQLEMLASTSEVEAVSIIGTSIRNGWQGLFLPNKPTGKRFINKSPLTQQDHTNGF
jgi:hypothetical protein